MLETMVAAAVLGVGLIGVVKLQAGALRGMKASSDLSSAADIASQLADLVASQPVDQLPACAPPAGPDSGCKQGTQPFARSFSSTVRSGCTWWFEGSAMPDGAGGLPPFAVDPTTAAEHGYHYRVDEVVLSPSNPTNGGMTLDVANHPNGSIVQVYVCWADEHGNVRQTMTSRFIGP